LHCAWAHEEEAEDGDGAKEEEASRQAAPFLWIIGIEKWTPPFLQSVAMLPLEVENLSTTTTLLSLHSLFSFLSPLSLLADNHTLPLPFLAEGARKHKIWQRLAFCYGPRNSN